MINTNNQTDTAEMQTMKTRQSRFAVDINAPREKVWNALTKDIGRWWPRDMIMGPAIRFCFDLKVGGNLWEDYGNGAGLVWGTIKGIIPGTKLILTTDVFPDMGGPARSIMEYQLDEIETGTRVTWSESRFGCIDDTIMMGQWLPPWKHGLGIRLKSYVEGKSLDSPSVEEI